MPRSTVRAVSAQRAAIRRSGALTSTRTSRPSRPMRLPNSDWPARSIARSPCGEIRHPRAGARPRSRRPRVPPGTGNDSCASRGPARLRARDQFFVGGGADPGVDASGAEPVRPPARCAPPGGRSPRWRCLRAAAELATAMPSSTWGRISRGSRSVTNTARTVATSEIANTVRGWSSDHIMPRSYELGEMVAQARQTASGDVVPGTAELAVGRLPSAVRRSPSAPLPPASPASASAPGSARPSATSPPKATDRGTARRRARGRRRSARTPAPS